jgi:hypothetical protein
MQDYKSNSTDEIICPHCGRSFCGGGAVKKADGGEVSILGKKRDANLPRHQLDVYRGENVPRGTTRDDLDEEEQRQMEYARALRKKYGR